jgi:hypothetical protein
MDNVSPVTTYKNSAQRREPQSKIACTVREAAQVSGLSRSILYLVIGTGALRARKHGARTLILDSDLRRFRRGLPLTKNVTSLGASA